MIRIFWGVGTALVCSLVWLLLPREHSDSSEDQPASLENAAWWPREGEELVVTDSIRPHQTGTISHHGISWTVRAHAAIELRPGERVVVERYEGDVLIVVPVGDSVAQS